MFAMGDVDGIAVWKRIIRAAEASQRERI